MDRTENQIFFDANKSLWNQKTAFHKDSKFYDLEGFLDGKTSLNQIEIEALGNVKGKEILHLQCHFGQDSLSLARMGAQVTGLDFSKNAIQLASELNQKLGLAAQFVEGNIYDTSSLIPGKFDIVFTSYGVICWLPDLMNWAKVISEKLTEGGIFYIVEFHPLLTVFDENNELTYPYFNTGQAFREEVQGTYADKEADIRHEEYFWFHSLGEVYHALRKNGLDIIDLQEIDYSPYNCFPNLVEKEKGKYVLDFPMRLPHLFSIKARKTYT